jgi:hypothetical protein
MKVFLEEVILDEGYYPMKIILDEGYYSMKIIPDIVRPIIYKVKSQQEITGMENKTNKKRRM